MEDKKLATWRCQHHGCLVKQGARALTPCYKDALHVLEIRNMVQCWSVNNAFVNITYFLWSPTCKQFVAFTFTFLQLPFNFQAGLIASALYDLHQFFRMISQFPGVCILVSCSLSRTILVSSDKYITILLSFLLNLKLLVNILVAHMMLATIFTLLTYIVFSLPRRQFCNYAVTSPRQCVFHMTSQHCSRAKILTELVVICGVDSDEWASFWEVVNFYLFRVFGMDDGSHQSVSLLLDLLPEASFGHRVLSSPASVYPSVCPCVCVCINHLLVRTITHQPFHLGSSNLHQRCKTPWLRFLYIWGLIDLDLQGQI